MTSRSETAFPQSSHWGTFAAVVKDGRIVEARPDPADPDPSPILRNIPDAIQSRARISQPMVRQGWLERGPGPDERRGAEPFVPVDWPTAIELLSGELSRVYDEAGAEAVYAGSYGWASAGRFHHAQSQMRRFLNCLGGFTSSVNTYSNAAGEVILDRVAGGMRHMLDHATAYTEIIQHTDLVVSFGGIPLKNTAVTPGGLTRHVVRNRLEDAAAKGVEFVLFSPVRDDLASFVNAEWNALRPGTDVAVMLALAHTLIVENRHDRAFLDRYCVGFDRLESYILGHTDGQAKDAVWAATLSEVPAETIRMLARRMAAGRTMVTVSWSLQRAPHGEQPPWMGLALAAMLGQIGLPGGGYGFGYGAMGYIGEGAMPFGSPSLPQGKNGVAAFIPVARVSDMLLNPGAPFDYDGLELTYPDIRLVYWTGGNPFHHHQDLGRLRRALAKPDTIVTHDPFWTAMARHSDIVLPATVTPERNDIGASSPDDRLIAMKQAAEPFGQARNEFDIFRDLARALGVEAAYTGGKSEQEWLESLYANWQSRLAAHEIETPAFAAFWEAGKVEFPEYRKSNQVLFADFRDDPEASPLATASGRFELLSEAIDGFGYDDCPGHPAWLEPAEWLGSPETSRFPLNLIANNPRTRLHSQLDNGAYSQESKIQGREPARVHPDDASARGIADGNVIRLFNDRGSCLAGAIVSDDVRPGVVQLSTGAWYDPLDRGDPGSMCVHGNPNVLTRDVGTSRLAQGCAGQHALIEIERWQAPLPPVTIFAPPPLIDAPTD